MAVMYFFASFSRSLRETCCRLSSTSTAVPSSSVRSCSRSKLVQCALHVQIRITNSKTYIFFCQWEAYLQIEHMLYFSVGGMPLQVKRKLRFNCFRGDRVEIKRWIQPTNAYYNTNTKIKNVVGKGRKVPPLVSYGASLSGSPAPFRVHRSKHQQRHHLMITTMQHLRAQSKQFECAVASRTPALLGDRWWRRACCSEAW